MEFMLTIRAFLALSIAALSVGCSLTAPAPTPDMAAALTQAYDTALAAFPTITPPPTNTPQPTPTAILDFGSSTSPYPRGTMAHLVLGGQIEINATILDVVRGQAAWDMIVAANPLNEPAPPGMEFLLIRVRLEYVGTDQGPLQLNINNMAVLSGGQVIDSNLARPCCLQNQLMDVSELTLPYGGIAEGVIPWPVRTDDPAPLLVVGLRADGSGGIFFSLTN